MYLISFIILSSPWSYGANDVPSCSFYARMHRKNGQFASLKENSGGSGWDLAQSTLQDGTPRPETV